MDDTDHGTDVERVLAVLRSAGEPLTTGRIQRRIASEGRDVAASVVREICTELAIAGRVEVVGEPPSVRYRLADDGEAPGT